MNDVHHLYTRRNVIKSCNRVEYDLDELLGGITANNAHAELSFGMPVG